MPLKALLFARCLFLALTFCTAAHAEESFIVGVGTHLMNLEGSPVPGLQMVVDAGINAVREDAFWSTAEPSLNQLRIVPQWRTYLSVAKDKNLTTLAILDYSTNFHGNLKPRTPELRKAYLNYVNYVTSQLEKKVDYWEIWNEWDAEGPKDTKLSADYATLVKAAVPLIRKNTPQARILAGAITSEGMDNGFADRLIDAGILEQIDGLSVHPYAHCAGMGRNTPEGWVKWLRDYIRHINEKAGKDVPIYLTEIGWPSQTANCPYTRETVASYIARTYFLARTLPTIKGMWWYDLVNDGEDKTDQEDNFGLLEHNMAPKPAYNVIKVISRYVREFTYDSGQSTMMNDVYLLYFNKGAERIVVGWAAGRDQEKQIVSQAPITGNLQLIDTAQPAKGKITSDVPWACNGDQCSAPVTLTGFPKIISVSTNTVLVKR
ncbi:MAG: hypothetical protein JWP80_2960 [Pseudomonas sp.]|nr:hypothetical protein [Pseudomonas sp.]